VAKPDRPVFALQADGSAAYTIQALWTMAREGLDVTVVLFNNRSYEILNMELARVGAQGADARAKAQLDIGRPDLDFVKVAGGFGVPARRAETAEQLGEALEAAVAEPGPHLIEAMVPPAFSERQLKAMPVALNALRFLPRPVASAIQRRLNP
jgi:acetolactate synthase-1/2/3 large subunit